MAGAFIIASYILLAVVAWPWGILAGIVHLAVFTACAINLGSKKSPKG